MKVTQIKRFNKCKQPKNHEMIQNLKYKNNHFKYEIKIKIRWRKKY